VVLLESIFPFQNLDEDTILCDLSTRVWHPQPRNASVNPIAQKMAVATISPHRLERIDSESNFKYEVDLTSLSVGKETGVHNPHGRMPATAATDFGLTDVDRLLNRCAEGLEVTAGTLVSFVWRRQGKVVMSGVAEVDGGGSALWEGECTQASTDDSKKSHKPVLPWPNGATRPALTRGMLVTHHGEMPAAAGVHPLAGERLRLDAQALRAPGSGGAGGRRRDPLV